MKLARKADTRRMAALSTEARRQLLELKRRSDLERMLLPDGPPRKRQTKRASPERQQCVMVAPVDELCDELNPVKPTQVVASTSREADFSEPATTSGLARSSCRANVSIEDVYESSISEDGMGGMSDPETVSVYSSPSPSSPNPYIMLRTSLKRPYQQMTSSDKD
ncbi:unnamed protein product, partial [Iphiclides podalirius]